MGGQELLNIAGRMLRKDGELTRLILSEPPPAGNGRAVAFRFRHILERLIEAGWMPPKPAPAPATNNDHEQDGA